MNTKLLLEIDLRIKSKRASPIRPPTADERYTTRILEHRKRWKEAVDKAADEDKPALNRFFKLQEDRMREEELG